MLSEFISIHRQELIARARAKVSARDAPHPVREELSNGVPLFLTQLCGILQHSSPIASARGEMGSGATQHGGDLLAQGVSISQVVHNYGDICQVITDLALDLHVEIPTDEFRTLNRCLDSAIASAVTEYARQRESKLSGAEVRRQGFFAHELRNQLHTAMLAFQVVKSGAVGPASSTTQVLERSLRGLRDIIDRSVSEVRLESGTRHKERLRVAEFLEAMEIDAAVDAVDRGLKFSVDHVDDRLLVEVDRHLFASAISNILQNAFKFTRPFSHVWLRAQTTEDSIAIEIEDECGGLPPGAAEAIFQPFEQRGANRSGMGLGLAISRQAVEANGGRITLRDLPGRGCIFRIDLPLVVGATVEP